MNKRAKSKRTPAGRAYDRMYEAQRRVGTTVTTRLIRTELAALDAERHPNESRSAALKRISGLSAVKVK